MNGQALGGVDRSSEARIRPYADVGRRLAGVEVARGSALRVTMTI